MTTKKVSVNDYFAGDAWGLEYFAGYTFPVGQYALKSVQPYFMGDRIEYVNGRNYLRTDNGVGISFQLDYGFRVDYEHVFTSSTDNFGRHEPGASALRFLIEHLPNGMPDARVLSGLREQRNRVICRPDKVLVPPSGFFRPSPSITHSATS